MCQAAMLRVYDFPSGIIYAMGIKTAAREPYPAHECFPSDQRSYFENLPLIFLIC
jgi:hypothetical protein